MKDIRRRKGKMKGDKRGKSKWEMNHEKLWTTGNKLRVLEGRVGGITVTGIGY